jgi:hypothetical protein
MRTSWGSPESRLNQVGTLLVILPSISASLLLTDLIPIDVPVGVLFAVVIISGAAGGAINLIGRGPLILGAIVGLAVALGGLSAVYGWLQLRPSVYWLEVALVYFIGTIPGFLLQRAWQGRVTGKTGPGD